MNQKSENGVRSLSPEAVNPRRQVSPLLRRKGQSATCAGGISRLDSRPFVAVHYNAGEEAKETL
jgi:hypothetical protein